MSDGGIVLFATDRQGGNVPKVSQLGRVIVPVSDQEAAIAFYTDKLGFTVSADVP